MAEKRTVFLSSKSARQRAHALIDAAPEGMVMRLAEATRTDTQNKALWPRIADIRAQVPTLQQYSPDQIKLMFLDALKTELVFLPKLEGAGMFPVGMKSSILTVEQFSALLELLNEFAARNGVVWSRQHDET